MAKIQILYPYWESKQIHQLFLEEAKAMNNAGFIVGTTIIDEADLIIYRGFTILNKNRYPIAKNMIQGWEENKRTLLMSEFIPVISNLTIPTFFVESLHEDTIIELIKNNRWDKAFIKSDSKSLFCNGDYASVWPDTSLDEMIDEYKKRKWSGPFAIRQFIDDPQIFYDEQRYWVLNGNPYHPSGVIPDFVADAAKRIYNFSGSHYFTIDVAGNYIVEVNPGESSDRGGDNPLEFFCEIFAKEFLNNPLFNKP